MRDQTVDPRVDHYFANSPIIARRLYKYYKRDAEVLYPPVDIDSYYNGGDEGFYLHLGRLDEEKGVPAIVEAFAESNHRLVLAGGRGDINDNIRSRIRHSENIEYRGFVDEDEKIKLLATCRAVVFNGRDEDFGIVPIEANASGKAILARNEGFPAVYVADGTNGYLHDGTPEEIYKVLERFEREDVTEPETRVKRFARDNFESQLTEQTVDYHNSFTSLSG
jgi:glycosyltransferase involved in cell wall biosynthesis